LEKEPALRYQTATEFRTQVETVSNAATSPIAQNPKSQTVPASATAGSRTLSAGKLPWQVWVVAGILALEGLGNLISISRQPEALIWVAAKILFITGLLRRWRPVYVLTLVFAGLHVVYFAAASPVAALLNLVLVVLLAYVYRFYFPKVEEASPGCQSSHSSTSGSNKLVIGFGVAVLVGVLLVAGAFAAWFAKRAEQQEALRQLALVREAEIAEKQRAQELAASESIASGINLPARAIPPVVVKTIPESGAGDVQPGISFLRVTFSKPMRDGSWSWVKLGDETFPMMAGAPHFLSDNQTCVLPVKLQPNKLYAVWINFGSATNFQDTGGQPALPYLLIFETRK